jgi:hypothetical protein
MCNPGGQPNRLGQQGTRWLSGRRPHVRAHCADGPAARSRRLLGRGDWRGSTDCRGASRARIVLLGEMVLSVRQVLEAVAELQEASLELVCWELNVHEDEAHPAFQRAVADGLLARRRVDELHDEVMYALTDAGRRTLAR